MRGLTPAERAVLASLCDVAPSHLIPIEEVEPTVRALCADGRAFASWDIIGEADRREMFDATDAGRLALRLWPATAATPGAGGQ